MNDKIHPQDAKTESEFHTCKAQAVAALSKNVKPATKVYALLSAASSITSDDDFFREAFEEVYSRRTLETKK
jgi:hypothetical protein